MKGYLVRNIPAAVPPPRAPAPVFDERDRTARIALPRAIDVPTLHRWFVIHCGLNAVGYCAKRRVLFGKRCAASGRSTLHVEAALSDCGRSVVLRCVHIQCWAHYLQFAEGWARGMQECVAEA